MPPPPKVERFPGGIAEPHRKVYSHGAADCGDQRCSTLCGNERSCLSPTCAPAWPKGVRLPPATACQTRGRQTWPADRGRGPASLFCHHTVQKLGGAGAPTPGPSKREKLNCKSGCAGREVPNVSPLACFARFEKVPQGKRPGRRRPDLLARGGKGDVQRGVHEIDQSSFPCSLLAQERWCGIPLGASWDVACRASPQAAGG